MIAHKLRMIWVCKRLQDHSRCILSSIKAGSKMDLLFMCQFSFKKTWPFVIFSDSCPQWPTYIESPKEFPSDVNLSIGTTCLTWPETIQNGSIDQFYLSRATIHWIGHENMSHLKTFLYSYLWHTLLWDCFQCDLSVIMCIYLQTIFKW